MMYKKPGSNNEVQTDSQDQGYGDLSELNRDGLILKSIGRKLLENFANDYLELLGTSSAIYEVNGDYAFGIFSSGWCRMMDSASHRLCDTADNAEALNSGRWLCHESCWTDCSKRAIAECASVDIECSGGIRIYAVPILAHGNAVGAINFGYGDPPNDPETLRKLADTYHCDYDDLAREAAAYESRPTCIIELAKKQLHATARIIGAMIETKQTEEALRKSEHQKELILNSMQEMFACYDLDLKIIWANQASADSMGVTQKEMVGKHCYEVWHNREIPCEGCIVLKVKETKQPQRGEMTTPDGKKWLLWGYPVFDDQGEVVNLIELGMDVTATKQAEIKFESYVTNSPTPFFVANSKGDYTFVNPAACELLGYTEEELLSMNIKDVGHPDEYEKNMQTFLQLMEEKQVHQEISLLRNDESNVYVILDAIMLDENNIFSFCTNIDDQKRAEEALRESEATIRNKLKAITEPDGDIGSLNLEDIIDSKELQNMMENFYKASEIGSAIIDVTGKILVGVGWQDICTKFHRIHPDSAKNCLESDIALAGGVPAGTFKAYRCKNNLWDMVSPIMVGEKHLGNIFIGQFFYEDEPVDYELFREQARQHGFDEAEYLAALDRVPRMKREAVESAMTFCANFATMISSLSYSKVKLSRDITARKQAEEALRESEELLTRSQEIAHTGSWKLDLTANRLTWSEEVYRIFGCKPQEFAPSYEAFLGFVHPEDRAAVDDAYSRSVQEGSDGYDIEHRIVRWKSGEIRYVHERCVHERDASGAIIQSTGMVQDITERKRIEDKHKQILDEYETVFQGTQEAIFLIEVTEQNSFRYIRNNQTHAKNTGFTAEQLAGLTPQELVGDELGDRIAENYRRCVSTGISIFYDETLDLPGGIKTWHTTLTPISQQGEIRFIVGSSKDITAQKKAEDEIKRFKTISDSAVYGKTIADLDGNIVYVNRFFAEIHGYSPEELIGNHVSMFNTPEQNKEIEQIFALLIQEGTFKPKEVWHVHRDGTEFPMLMSGVLLKDEQGNPQYFAASAIDMSAYHQSQQNYQLLFDSMQNGFSLNDIICDDSGVPIDYRFLSVNPAFEAMTGLKADDIIGYCVLDVLPNTERFWIDTYGRVALTGESVSFEHYSGEFNKHFDVTAFRPAEGRFACIFQDITERKLADQFTHIRMSLLEYAQTHSLEELMLRILEEAESLTGSSISFYHFVDRDQVTLSLQAYSVGAQKEFCKTVGKGMHYALEQAGVEKQPVIHNDYASLTHRKGLPEGHAPIIREMVIPILRGNDIVGLLGVGNKPDDYTNRDKDTISYLADITWEIIEHRRAEEELKEMQVHLTQMQKMETVGRLAGGIAHDFNNMLGVILGHAEMGLEQVHHNQAVHDNLLEIHKAAERSAELTAQLLAFARKQTVSPKVLDLNNEISDMINMIQRLIGEDVDLLWRPCHDIWAVQIDPSQVHQILVNLCVNAREAISGMGKVTIETKNMMLDESYCAHHEQLIPGEFVLLSVSDDGCGIDEMVLPHIFEPFFTTSEVGKGTGMGLATVHGIVKQNSGCINVYSEQGTTMNIYLPKHAEKATQRVPDTIQAEMEKGAGIILLVDDNPSILSMTKKLLERLGYTILAANTPMEAIRIAETSDHSIDLLMTDVVMPEMNGRDLANTVLTMHPDIKLLFMSGYTDNAIAHQGVLDEGVSFIQKPFSMKDLSTKIRELLLG